MRCIHNKTAAAVCSGSLSFSRRLEGGEETVCGKREVEMRCIDTRCFHRSAHALHSLPGQEPKNQ